MRWFLVEKLHSPKVNNRTASAPTFAVKIPIVTFCVRRAHAPNKFRKVVLQLFNVALLSRTLCMYRGKDAADANDFFFAGGDSNRVIKTLTRMHLFFCNTRYVTSFSTYLWLYCVHWKNFSRIIIIVFRVYIKSAGLLCHPV